jgi:hypothetical protein
MDRREFVATVTAVSAGIIATGAGRAFAGSGKDVSALSEEFKGIVMSEAVQKRVPHDNPFFKYRVLKTRASNKIPATVLDCERAFVYDGRVVKEMTNAGRNMLVPGVEIACNPEVGLNTYCSLGYQDKVGLANEYLDSIFRSEQEILKVFLGKGLTPEVYPYVDVVVLAAGYKDMVGVTLFENFAIAARID